MTEIEQAKSRCIKELGLGTIMMGIAGFLYWRLTVFEQAGEAVKQTSGIISTIHHLGGKNFVCIAFTALGIIPLLLGIIDIFHSLKKPPVVEHKTHPNFRLGED